VLEIDPKKRTIQEFTPLLLLLAMKLDHHSSELDALTLLLDPNKKRISPE
jgi:hypothetical protein